MLDKKIYINKLGKINSNKLKENWIKKNDIIFYKKIYKDTANYSNLDFVQRLFLSISKQKVIPTCQECKKGVKFVSVGKGYQKYCSRKCAQQSIFHKIILYNKRSITNIIKYGTANLLQNNEIKRKIRRTVNNRSDIKKYIISKKKEITNILRYGVKYVFQSDEIKRKIKETHIVRYGVSYISKSKEIKRKIKKTNIVRYGVSNPSKNKSIKNKIISTNLLKYGCKYILQNKDIRNKIKLTNLLKYGNIHTLGLSHVSKKRYQGLKKHIQDKRQETYYNIKGNLSLFYIKNFGLEYFKQKGLKGPYTIFCKKCKEKIEDTFIYNQRFLKCFHCNPNNGISQAEKDILKYIKEYFNSDIENNNREILKGKELDIYIPEKNLAIEYNGIMWHSIGKHKSSKFNNYFLENYIKKKHLWKTEECKKQNIQLLHIFENEWLDENKQNIWKNIINGKLGINNRIYGRNTYIKQPSVAESSFFLNRYHLQGNIGSKVKIGLYSKKDIFNKKGELIIQKDELISLMIFGKSRYGKADWEILRFVSKNGINITGGASKMFKYFLNNFVNSGEKIKTYADLKFSNGEVYKKLGFNLISQSNPNYFYFKTNSYNLESRVKYQKHKLKDKLEIFDKNLTESQNMYNNGYRKIYDCGNLVFEYIKE